jgi:hypothetical protein
MEENEFFDEVECELDIFNDAPLDKKKVAQDDVHKEDAKPKTKNLFEDLELQNDDDDEDSLRVTSPHGQEEITSISHTAAENAEATSSINHKQVRK